MKNGKALHKIIGCGVVLLAVFVFANTGYSRNSCGCQTCGQGVYPPPQPIDDNIELKYRDGFPGNRQYKRQQVKKLQCMLRALGYCSGPVDGWYGHSTARAVMLFLADNFQQIGYGKKVTDDQWKYLVHWAGSHCTKYDKQEEPSKPSYYQYQDYQDYRQGQQYRFYQQYQN